MAIRLLWDYKTEKKGSVVELEKSKEDLLIKRGFAEKYDIDKVEIKVIKEEKKNNKIEAVKAKVEENTNGIITEKTEAELEEMTVKELLTYAKDKLNLDLNKKDKKDNIIQEIQEAYENLEEVDVDE